MRARQLHAAPWAVGATACARMRAPPLPRALAPVLPGLLKEEDDDDGKPMAGLLKLEELLLKPLLPPKLLRDPPPIFAALAAPSAAAASTNASSARTARLGDDMAVGAMLSASGPRGPRAGPSFEELGCADAVTLAWRGLGAFINTGGK